MWRFSADSISFLKGLGNTVFKLCMKLGGGCWSLEAEGKWGHLNERVNGLGKCNMTFL